MALSAACSATVSAACAVPGELLIPRGITMFDVIGIIIFGAVIGVLA
jgi:hypothetical protein